MSKVPVGASIAHAYQFLFGRFFQIIGTAWLPGLLYGLGVYAMLGAMRGWTTDHGVPPPMLAGMVVWAFAALAFFAAIRSVLGISLTQEAFGIRKDLTLAHFVVGPRELRLFFGYARYYLLFFVLHVAVVLLCVAALWAAKTYGGKLVVNGYAVALPLARLFCVVLIAAFALSMLRLLFMLAPVAAAEHRTRLSRAWAISHNSTWRILFTCIGTFLPLMVAGWAALYFLIGAGPLQDLVHALQARPGDPSPVLDFAAGHAAMLAMFGAVAGVIGAALLAGASACAYRATTGHEDPEPEDDAALVAPLLTPVEPAHPVAPPHHEETHDHGHGGHDDHGHGHDDHGHGGHDHGHQESQASDDDEGGEGHGHGDHGHGHSHDDHGHGHNDAHASQDEDDDDEDDHDADKGHGGHDDHGHGDHGHGSQGHDDHGHHHHAKAADEVV
ncbi:MAG TPA: hypothetical protein VG387_01770 [Rhizomicrobium sp.]|jgi:hypothetical protein|nr:hypothetical protein [Rhizomicrobium sp.]